MPTTNTTPLPPPTAWQVEHLRFTVFGDTATLDPTAAWRGISGAEPEIVANQPKQGMVQVQGKVDDQRRLALQVQPRRVDWVLGPADVEAPPTEGFFAIGALPTALGDFLGLLHRWLPTWPAADRLALAGVMHQPQADRGEGYKQIQQYLLGAVTLDPESSDFLYQINRPRPSQTGIPNLRINRLTKWSVAFQTHLSGTDLTRLSEVSHRYACRLDFDINTSADFRDPLPQGAFPAILAEFAALVGELAEKGDVK